MASSNITVDLLNQKVLDALVRSLGDTFSEKIRDLEAGFKVRLESLTSSLYAEMASAIADAEQRAAQAIAAAEQRSGQALSAVEDELNRSAIASSTALSTRLDKAQADIQAVEASAGNAVTRLTGLLDTVTAGLDTACAELKTTVESLDTLPAMILSSVPQPAVFTLMDGDDFSPQARAFADKLISEAVNPIVNASQGALSGEITKLTDQLSTTSRQSTGAICDLSVRLDSVTQATKTLQQDLEGRIDTLVPERVATVVDETAVELKKLIDLGIKTTIDSVSRECAELETRMTVRLVAKVQSEVDRIPRPRDGKDGEDGKNGTDARVLPPVPYEAGQQYALGTWVAHAGAVWVAARSTSAPPAVGSPHWDCVAAGVAKVEPTLAQDGRTVDLYVQLSDGTEQKSSFTLPVPVVRGPYAPTATYAAHDIVQYDGTWWEAQRSGELPAPGTDPAWRLQIKRARDGRPGKDMAPAPWRFRDPWSGEDLYLPGDVTEHAGVHWMAKRSTRERPPFMLLVSNDNWLKLGA